MIANPAQLVPVSGKAVTVAACGLAAMVVDIEYIGFGLAVFHLDGKIAFTTICPRLQQAAGFHTTQADDIVENGLQ